MGLSCEVYGESLFSPMSHYSVVLKNSERSIDPLGLIEIKKVSFIETDVGGVQLFKTEYNSYL